MCREILDSVHAHPSCAARDVWSDLTRAMYGVLQSTTLYDLVERQKKKASVKEIVYDI